MTSTIANTTKYLGRHIGGWLPDRYLGEGNSAVVYRAEKEGSVRAIKIFDPEMAAKVDQAELEERLDRQLALIGKKHPNLVQIIDGGFCPDNQCHFLVMEYIDAPNMFSLLGIIPPEKIELLISQVAAAAQFLEEHGLAHRDIKPDNIAVSPNFETAILLDLGVLRPLGPSELTDTTNKKPNIGTKRYSPPELAKRTNLDTVEGWRAITFYQLGAVIHDMVMGKRIFKDMSASEGQLYEAIYNVVPEVDSNLVNPTLVRIARNCLSKEYLVRLQTIKWEDFQFPKPTASRLENIRTRIQTRRDEVRNTVGGILAGEIEQRKNRQLLHKNIELLHNLVRTICLRDTVVFPRIDATFSPTYSSDGTSTTCGIRFEDTPDHGLGARLYLNFTVVLLSRSEEIVQVYISGVLCNGEAPSKWEGKWYTVLEGKVVPNDLEHELNGVMTNAIDDALTLSEAFKQELRQGKPIWVSIHDRNERAK